MQIKFPSSFLWGASLSGYQCEGGNFNSDWFSWEKEKKLEEAGRACDHYNLFEKDFKLARELNLKSVRLSVEWPRIYPASNIVSEQEIAHYQKVIDCLLEQGIKPVVTLHHFTNPLWFMGEGGWLGPKSVDYFITYLKTIVGSLKDKVDTWLIFNEPLVYIYNGFLSGIWPPGKKSLVDARKALKNILNAYLVGYQEINSIYQGSLAKPQISLAKHFRVFSGCPEGNFLANSFSAFLRNKSFNFWMVDYLCRRRSLDFIGVNYYCKEYVKSKGLWGESCNYQNAPERVNHLGWNVYSQGFLKVLTAVSKFKLPIIVTENGTAEKEEGYYEDFLISHIKSLVKAREKGADIRGYFWWSLLDNFEWDKGFKHRFGLLDVDYQTMERKIRKFAFTYAKICKENTVDVGQEENDKG